MPIRPVFAANARAGAGGQGQFLGQMAAALADTGATIFARTTGAGHQAGDIAFKGLPKTVFDVLLATPVLRGRQDWLTLLSDVEFDRSVARRLAVEPAYDVFEGVMAQCADAIPVARRAGARVIVTSLNTHISHLHRVLDDEYARVGDRGHHFVHPAMVKRALAEIAAADHIRVNSNVAKETFVGAGLDPSRVTVIHPSVDLAHFHDAPKPDDVFRVMAVASIDPRKGIQYLINAFIDAKLPNAALDIIGGTSDRWSSRLMADATSRDPRISVRQLDVSASPVAASYARASVLVHPAIEDGFGLVVPQALASGRPVIVTSTSGASELVRDGEAGFVVEPRSTAAIADRLKTLCHDHALRSQMSACARPSVSHLTADAFARAVREMYARI